MPENLELKPRITVIGVGGAGGNAVSNMIRAKLEGVEFVVANTDAQALGGFSASSPADPLGGSSSLMGSVRKIQLGLNVTQGLGAGSKPDVGRAAAEESYNEIVQHLRGSNMVFITAGMGGGSGTGAAPVIARAAREEGILTVGVVTKPFHFEGSHRSRTAERGIEELQQHVDTLIIIPNQNLFRLASERTTFAESFKMADEVLYSGVRGVTDLMMKPGLINLDFADVRAIMAEMGKAMMGTGEAEGDRRALDAAEAAISNPLLDDVSMKGAKGVLINITGGYDMTLYEVDEAANRVRDEVDPEANIIFGSTFDEMLDGKMRVSVVATGIGGMHSQPQSALQAITSHNIAARPINLAAAAMSRESAQSIYYGPASLSSGSTAEQGEYGKQASSFPEGEAENAGSSQTGKEASTEAEVLAFTVKTTPSQEQEATPEPVAPPQADFKKESSPAAPPENAGESRRPTSLFERFTGVSRAKAAPPPAQLTKVLDAEEPAVLDMLEIPAFLRRGS